MARELQIRNDEEELGLHDMDNIDQFELNPYQMEDISDTVLISMHNPGKVVGNVVTFGIGGDPIPTKGMLDPVIPTKFGAP